MADRVPRHVRLRQIQELRAWGLTYPQIADRLGCGHSTVHNIVTDPDGSKQRERKKRYQGVCADCGGPTDGSNGRGKAPMRCSYCAQGKARPEPPDARRTCPVRLADIPIDVRLAGAREANRYEPGEYERQEILFAALFPSENVYFVAESARAMLAGVAA